VVRVALALATIVFAIPGFLLPDGRLLAASAVFGLIWTLWDLLWEHVFGPAVDWTARVLTEGVSGPPVDTRPTLDDTIRLLESHLAGDSARSVKIQAALRLEEIYRTVRKDPARADEVTARIRALYPDAPELSRWQDRRPDA
jgi:hypothetical protein